MQHGGTDCDEEVHDLAVVGQARMERGRSGGEDAGDAAELSEQLVDDRAGLRRTKRLQQPL
ncbi:MAG: hypothetical protein EOP18_01075 [Rhizobiaceae bacterium]|nr:MAG: hypothetical protein EOP18_01075 [Rhizobiaceae bacterium]